MIAQILQTKTLKSLMRVYLREIPRFFSFQECSVMFHDSEKDLLYTITYGDDEEKKAEYHRQRKLA